MSIVMAWICLILAGVFETVWAVGLKYTEGFTRLYPSILTLVAMGFSFFMLAQSLRALPMGTAYTVWTGIGAVGTVIYGVYFLDEPANLGRLLCIFLIVVAVVGLKLSSR